MIALDGHDNGLHTPANLLPQSHRARQSAAPVCSRQNRRALRATLNVKNIIAQMCTYQPECHSTGHSRENADAVALPQRRSRPTRPEGPRTHARASPPLGAATDPPRPLRADTFRAFACDAWSHHSSLEPCATRSSPPKVAPIVTAAASTSGWRGRHGPVLRRDTRPARDRPPPAASPFQRTEPRTSVIRPELAAAADALFRLCTHEVPK